MVLLIDNFDSFTFNLVDYFNQLEVECLVIRNDISLEKIKTMEFNAIVISPGSQTPDKSGVLMEFLNHYYHKFPMLGICLGHQAIGQFFGGKIIKAPKPMHGKISKIRVEEDTLFENIPQEFKVVRYNSLLVRLRGHDLMPLAWSSIGELMALRHKVLPIWGVQFHPEAELTEYGLQLLKNWLDYNRIAS